MADLERVRAMLRMAHKDFNALIGMQDNPLFADEIFGFHIQQAVEKALKAWLCIHGDTYPMTHELARLLAFLETRGVEVDAYWPLVQYTIFAVQARYEEGITELDEPIDRTMEIQNVRALLTQVERAIVAHDKLLDNDDLIMLSALQHYSYCPRQCALIHVEQAFDENVHTMRGNAAHQRVDEPGFESFEGVRSEKALPVWSERLGLIGKCDVVEFYPDGRIYPVEYKHGKKRAKAHDDIQLAAQAICLEEMTGKPVTHGAIYHHTSRRRREVAITDALRRQVEETVAAIRALLASGKLPPPVNDARCKECSLKEICQPHALADKTHQHELLDELFNID